MRNSSGSDAAESTPDFAASRRLTSLVALFASRLSNVMAVLAAILLLALMALTVADFVGRKFFNTSLSGMVELTEVSMVAIVYLGLANAERHGDHVRIDLVVSRLRGRVARAVIASGTLVSTVIVVALAWRLLVYSSQLHTGGYRTPIFGIALDRVALVAAFGAAVYALVALTAGTQPHDDADNVAPV